MTTQTTGRSSRSTTTIFATTAIACYTYFVLALLLMHVLRPDYTPASHMISDYAVGPYGWIMTTAFLALSGASLMLLLGLARRGPRSIAARLGTLVLGIASLGLLISAIFPTDLDGTPSTRTGDIHTISFLVNVGCSLLSTVLLSLSFGSDPRWRPYRRTALILALLMVLAFVLQFLTLRRGMPYGLTNRLFVALAIAWPLATSFRLRALSRE